MAAFLRRLAYWLRSRRAADELNEELQFHRDMAERDLRREGIPAPDAARAVRRTMGNTMLAREDARSVWVAPWLDAMWQDVRHGFRSLRRSPGLVIVSALSLGLGIGLNTVLFMGISTVYGHQPTMDDPERVVGVEPGYANQFSYPDYRDLKNSSIFTDAAGFRTGGGLNMGASGRLTPVSLLVVTANYFEMLGVRAQVGHTFTAAEAAPEHNPRLVVVTSTFWKNWLRGDPAAIGEAIVLGGEPFTVVGVLPEDYRAVFGWIGPQVYVPVSKLTLSALEDRGTPSLSVLARLTPGATTSQAQAAVTTFTASLERMYPERLTSTGRSVRVFPAQAMQFRGAEMGYSAARVLSLVTGGLVFLIACVNVAGLLMARATERRREIAVRVAIGAGRARVVQAMLVESLLLVLTGGAVGLTLASLVNWAPWPSEMGPLRDAMVLNSRILPYALPVVLLTTLVCGMFPALRATRKRVVDAVRQSEGVTPRTWMRQALVVGQLAMSLFLVVATLLFVRSQIRIGQADVGFDLDHGIVARFGLDQRQYAGAARARFAERLVDRIRQIPGVSLASTANVIPLGGDSLLRSFHPAGRTDIPGTRPSTYSVGPDFFRTLGIRLLKGREFDRTHREGTLAVAIVNETFARTYFPGQEVIGQHVQTEDEPDAEVIGLVRDHRIGTIGEAPQSVIYYPFDQRPRTLIVHARTSSPDGLITSVQQAIDEVDATVPVNVQTLRSATSLEMNMRRLGTILVGAMGAVGLLLAMIGLYGVMSYVAASRTAEVGIRMALGASGPRIRQEMLLRALNVVGRGVALGALASLGLTPLFRTFLAGVSPFDPVAFAGAAIVLTLIGLAASFVPALRSSRLDPMRALRQL